MNAASQQHQAANGPKPVLEVVGLSRDFGGLRALNDLDVTINEGEIVALIGPNGAGKTTFFNCVTGIYTPTEGEIYLHDANGQKQLLNGRKPHIITGMGMARTFQNIRLFGDMTVLENVMIGRHCRTTAGIWGALTRNAHTRREEQDTIDRSYALLETVNLAHLWNESARNLSYGAQRRLEIARALATEPRMLLLDEPAAGMNPHETQELEALVRSLRSRHSLSILLIEHDMGMVMSLSDRIYVMEYGSRIAAGTPEEVRSNPRVIQAYLGESDDA
ncbi:MAG TPA: ABC transporter ATP-binding protein [Candidatus Desulfovibrio intestinavium]|uniref:ABC transporter ATP-binding protein n=1 Tax=Candidatus Desulfovibrio intestinavium TaxID=2838534 RepID=A0A9D2HQN9_9BACT|nr:ABC transporter ATP-binding protein [Candidatus Desulfovibrio intestinavium]